jgi:trimethylamine--corrinoid protein Co-methyltransferase
MNRIVNDLNQENQEKIHHMSLRILSEVGIRFHHPEALEIFNQHGAKIDGSVVFLSEKDVEKGLATVPEQFEVLARNPENNIIVGGDHHVLGPGYGAPFVVESDGRQRNATMDDYQKFCKLAHTSESMDFLGSIMVQPAELDATTCHLDMLMGNITLSDKVSMGSTASEQAALDSLALGKILFGNLDRPVMIGLINSLAPLQYAEEMVIALIQYARAGQPVIVHGGVMMGSTGPITEAGTQAMQNAMNLAGICLAQFTKPGAPVIYGASGTPLDMKTGGYATGSPEMARCTAAHAIMGRYYRIPTRGGGAFNDALVADYQCGSESTLVLTAAAASGINLSLHSCGIMGAYIGMSYEKFILDEEMCGIVKKLIQPANYDDEEFAMDLIKEIGIGGQYLSSMHTLKRCRTAFYPNQVFNKVPWDKWNAQGGKWAHKKAGEMVAQRLESYEKPDMASGILADLERYIQGRKA